MAQRTLLTKPLSKIRPLSDWAVWVGYLHGPTILAKGAPIGPRGHVRLTLSLRVAGGWAPRKDEVSPSEIGAAPRIL